ncbi:hypothetical protein HAX54_047094 [Datura stramonium]|uniref:Uncharacterized protein n=1 Tax=Datura stramonium TaxID=4076 RepID=A0ABS8SSE8_DATST|nr:hypothetical protein [Datura stramonium]
MALVELLDGGIQINCPSLMISHLTKMVMKKKQNHSLPYGFFLTEVFEKFGVPIPVFEPYSHYDAIDYYEIGGHHNDVFAKYDIAVEVKDLRAQIEKNEEVAAVQLIVLVALIIGLSQSSIPFISPTTQSIPNPSTFTF